MEYITLCLGSTNSGTLGTTIVVPDVPLFYFISTVMGLLYLYLSLYFYLYLYWYIFLSKTSSAIHIFNFRYLSAGRHIDVSKDARIRGYFSKPKIVREQKVSGNTVLDESSKPCAFIKCPEHFTEIIDCRFTARLFDPNMQLARWVPRSV